MKLKIGLDLDDTVNSWYPEYLKMFGAPKNNYEITKNVHNKLKNNKKFWLNLPIINRPNFDVTLYCTKRIIPKQWCRQFLIENNLPIAPIYQVFCQSSPKSTRIKGRIDVFIDDSISNFIEMNLHGVPCLLMDTPNNQDWGPVGRIYSLDINEIEDAYRLFINTIFPNFKKLL